MINSNAYDYINVLSKAADAAWLRNEALANNLANANTPGYKRQEVTFESELQKALGNNRYETMDSKVSRLKINRLSPRTYTDYSGFSYRLDGNNVDPETENVMLASNQLKYNALVTAYNQEFSNLKMVMR